ncbi:MAG: dTDP-4-dehydrorhamnose 3,5-epimerase [Elusimicrobia bacterium]|nr:dTDP-4-dehydrorhamnose 3,5-epimerase [Elusimicrobiota bacterium]
MAFKLTPYEIPGLLIVEGQCFPDERGFFMESYKAKDLPGTPIPPLVQDNLSRSKKGVIRGLHYQRKPSPIGKLVRCLRGRIFDVAVDIRKGSPTYAKWASIELTDEGNRMFWIPVGFAHGFQTLSDEADVMYKQNGYWAPADDCGIVWNDPDIAVKWPLPDALVSPKDGKLPALAATDSTFVWKAPAN